MVDLNYPTNEGLMGKTSYFFYMELVIISPEGELLKEKAERVTLPGSMGAFSVLKSHAPLVSTLEKGEIIYIQNKKEKNYDIEGGVAIVEKDIVRVIVE